MSSTVKRRRGELKANDENCEKEEEKRKRTNKLKFVYIYIFKSIKKKIKRKHKYSFFLGIFIIFLICSGFFQVLNELYHKYFYNFKYIDTSNTEKLKEVFFGNKPYLVYCKNDKYKRIHPVIISNRLNYPEILNIAIINCKGLLSSNKNIYQRFNLREDTPAFIVRYGKNPRPIDLNLLNNKKKFLLFIRESMTFVVPHFKKFPQFDKKCLYKNGRCILFISEIILTYNHIKYNYINDIFINNKFFSINPMIIDNKKFQLKLNNEIFTSYHKNKYIHVLCLFNHYKDNIVEYYGYFYKEDFENFKKLSNFILSCINATHKTNEAVKLSNTPEIKYRTYKKKKF